MTCCSDVKDIPLALTWGRTYDLDSIRRERSRRKGRKNPEDVSADYLLPSRGGMIEAMMRFIRAVMIRLRVDAPSTSYSLPLPLPIILSHTRSDAPSSGTPLLLPINRYRDIFITPDRHLLLRNSNIRLDEMLVDMPGAPATNDTELGGRMIEFTTSVRQDTDEIYNEGYGIMYFGGSTAGSDYKVTSSGPQETGGDYRDAGSRPQEDRGNSS
ncbi:hypothetical protein Tco_0631804 [Tanacetum coccineum]